MSISRKQQRELNKINSISNQLFKKQDELIELAIHERREIWDGTESPQIRHEDEKRGNLQLEYDAIYNELQMALEDYGWRN